MSAKLLLAELYRGDDPTLVQLRNQLESIARTPGLVIVLIEGAPGTGKTTMARALAMARMLSMIDPQHHGFTADRAAKDVRQIAPLKWYRDISLTGLTDTLADSQLFGVGKKIATDVAARVGVFEQAMTGCLNPKTDKSHAALVAETKPFDPIPLATGGAVLLDEIGDLPQQLQAKLLRVLNGEMQYRVGTEGNSEFGFVFRGLVALATWRNIDDECQLREDLRQRICQHRVRVPGISDYPSEVRAQIILSAAEVVRNEIRDELAHVDTLLSGTRKDATPILAAEWLVSTHRNAGVRLSTPMLAKLADVRWADCGQLRGLRAALKRILCGTEVEVALAETRAAFTQEKGPPLAQDGVDRMRRYLAEGGSFSDAWRDDRHAWATEVLRLIEQDDPVVRLLIAGSGRQTGEIKKELRNLTRSGSNQSGN